MAPGGVRAFFKSSAAALLYLRFKKSSGLARNYILLFLDGHKPIAKVANQSLCQKIDKPDKVPLYMDGNFGDYITQIQLNEGRLETSCDCPYPGSGCKHVVAALLDVRDIMAQWQNRVEAPVDEDPYLTPEEIKQSALEDRQKRASQEGLYGDRGRHASVHPEIVDFGSRQGPSIFKTAGIAGYVEDFKNARTPPGTKRCYLRMDTC